MKDFEAKHLAAIGDAIKGQNINLVEFSVSHYLLARALEPAPSQRIDDALDFYDGLKDL